MTDDDVRQVLFLFFCIGVGVSFLPIFAAFDFPYCLFDKKKKIGQQSLKSITYVGLDGCLLYIVEKNKTRMVLYTYGDEFFYAAPGNDSKNLDRVVSSNGRAIYDT